MDDAISERDGNRNSGNVNNKKRKSTSSESKGNKKRDLSTVSDDAKTSLDNASSNSFSSSNPLDSLAEIAALYSAQKDCNHISAPSSSSSSLPPHSMMPPPLPQFSSFSSSSSSNPFASTILPSAVEVDWKGLYEQELVQRLRTEARLNFLKEEVIRLNSMLANIHYMQMLSGGNVVAGYGSNLSSNQRPTKK